MTQTLHSDRSLAFPHTAIQRGMLLLREVLAVLAFGCLVFSGELDA